MRATALLFSAAVLLVQGARASSPTLDDEATPSGVQGGRRGLRSKLSKLVEKASEHEHRRQHEQRERVVDRTIDRLVARQAERKDNRAARMAGAKAEAVALAAEESARADAADQAVADARSGRQARRQARSQGRRVERRVAGRRAGLASDAAEARQASNEAAAAVKAAAWEREEADWNGDEAAAAGLGAEPDPVEAVAGLAQPFHFPEVGTWVRLANFKAALNGRKGVVAAVDAESWTVTLQLEDGAAVLKKVKLDGLRYFPPLGATVRLRPCAGDGCKLGVRLQTSLVGQKGVLEAVDLQGWCTTLFCR
jgi:hypothetical protein